MSEAFNALSKADGSNHCDMTKKHNHIFSSISNYKNMKLSRIILGVMYTASIKLQTKCLLVQELSTRRLTIYS